MPAFPSAAAPWYRTREGRVAALAGTAAAVASFVLMALFWFTRDNGGESVVTADVGVEAADTVGRDAPAGTEDAPSANGPTAAAATESDPETDPGSTPGPTVTGDPTPTPAPRPETTATAPSGDPEPTGTASPTTTAEPTSAATPEPTAPAEPTPDPEPDPTPTIESTPMPTPEPTAPPTTTTTTVPPLPGPAAGLLELDEGFFELGTIDCQESAAGVSIVASGPAVTGPERAEVRGSLEGTTGEVQVTISADATADRVYAASTKYEVVEVTYEDRQFEAFADLVDISNPAGAPTFAVIIVDCLAVLS